MTARAGTASPMSERPSIDEELIDTLRATGYNDSGITPHRSLINPDGPNAADRLESLLSDRAKLEERVRELIAANERAPMHLRMPYEVEATEHAKRPLHD